MAILLSMPLCKISQSRQESLYKAAKCFQKEKFIFLRKKVINYQFTRFSPADLYIRDSIHSAAPCSSSEQKAQQLQAQQRFGDQEVDRQASRID